jgi:hypothetical protein
MTQDQPRHGRKPLYVDLEELEKPSVLQCTNQEIAGMVRRVHRHD